MTIPNTGGYLNFETIAKPGVILAAGRHLLRVAFDSNGANGIFAGNRESFQFSVVTPPQLSIIRAENQVMVSWPASALGFRLRVSGSLNRPILWTDVGQTPIPIAGRLTVTFRADQTERFYRLIAP